MLITHGYREFFSYLSEPSHFAMRASYETRMAKCGIWEDNAYTHKHTDGVSAQSVMPTLRPYSPSAGAAGD